MTTRATATQHKASSLRCWWRDCAATPTRLRTCNQIQRHLRPKTTQFVHSVAQHFQCMHSTVLITPRLRDSLRPCARLIGWTVHQHSGRLAGFTAADTTAGPPASLTPAWPLVRCRSGLPSSALPLLRVAIPSAVALADRLGRLCDRRPRLPLLDHEIPRR